MGIGALLGLFLLLLLVGGASGAAVVLAFKGKPPVLAPALADSHPANANPPPKTDNNDPAKPIHPDKPADPAAGTLAADLSQENFDKIDKGMTDAVLVERFGPPTFTRDSKQAGADKDLVWRVGGVGPRVTVSMHAGRVVAKASGQDWPVVYPK